jgi:NADH-quinone oxidoreductase subunit L
LWLLTTTPTIVILAIPISYYYFIKNTNILENFKKVNLPLYNFLFNKWYIDELYEIIFIKPIKNIGMFLWKKGDEGTIDKFGPNGVSKLIKLISNKAVQFQSGYIYDYAFVMLIGLSALITYLILT